jgi:hypothetical protein
VGRPALARLGPGGGEVIQALRAHRSLSAGLAALALLAALAAYPALESEDLGAPLGVLGAAAGLLLAFGLVTRLAPLIPPALVLLGGGYALYLAIETETVDPWAPVYAAGLLVLAELAYASVEHQAAPDEAAMLARRVATMVALAVGAVVLGTILLATASVGSGGGLAVHALGAVAAAAALALLALLAWRRRA